MHKQQQQPIRAEKKIRSKQKMPVADKSINSYAHLLVHPADAGSVQAHWNYSGVYGRILFLLQFRCDFFF